jgi:dipeptidyl aminopeptidase/acylaminoacyl peptidase
VLAFLSDRDTAGVFQLYLLDRARWGEAVAAPPVPGTIEYVEWSPDGRRLLLGVAGVGAELSGGQGSGTNGVPDQGLPSWYPVVEQGAPGSAWRGLWLYTPESGELVQLNPEGLNCWEAAWCGISAVLAVTSDGPREDDWYDAELSLLDISTGHRVVLLRSDPRGSSVLLGLPAGSPDGRYAAVVQGVCSDREIVAGDLTLVDLRSGEATVVDTAGADVTRVRWLDGRRVGYIGQRHLDSVGGVADIGTGEVREVFSTPVSCGSGRYPDGAFTVDGRILIEQNAYHLPPQLVLAGDDKEEVLASTADAGTDHLLSLAGRADPVSWPAPDRLEIEGVLVRPPGDGPFPLVVSIHGGPIWAYRNQWSMRWPYVPPLVARGYAVLCPNPRGSGGRGRDFARRVVGDMGGADARDILSGIDALVERGIADPARIGLIGGSYGGFMTSWLVTQDQRFAAAVAITPITDWYSKCFTSNTGSWAKRFLTADPEQPGTMAHSRSPVLRASRARTPCLNIAGARDRCTPPGQAREFHQALQAHGVESVLVTYPGEGHGVRSYPAVTDFLTRVLGWFATHMPAR